MVPWIVICPSVTVVTEVTCEVGVTVTVSVLLNSSLKVDWSSVMPLLDCSLGMGVDEELLEETVVVMRRVLRPFDVGSSDVKVPMLYDC